MAKSPLVAISVLNWNGWQDTLECLRSIRALDYPHYLMIVVDNGSRNDSVARIKEWAMRNFGDLHIIVEYSAGPAHWLWKDSGFGRSSPRLWLVWRLLFLGWTSIAGCLRSWPGGDKHPTWAGRGYRIDHGGRRRGGPPTLTQSWLALS
jgi:hypothetical protein